MIINALINQLKLFLGEDMGIGINDVKVVDNSPDKLPLSDYTSMIGIGGSLNLMIAITFEERLIEALAEVFMEGETIAKEEKEEIFDSICSESINTVVGLALPSFPKRGKDVTITPPITISDASTIRKYKDSKIITANIVTEFGKLSISTHGNFIKE